MNCQYCNHSCQKAGKQPNGNQKYYCKSCNKYQQANYKYNACNKEVKRLFLKCIKVGNSLSGIHSITGVAVSTQIRWIRELGRKLSAPEKFKSNDTYELDELCTYVKGKTRRKWVVSAISRSTGRIVEIKVGTRTKTNLSIVVNKLLQLNPKAIYTDKLRTYKSLIPEVIHKIKQRGINKIERFHLSLRIHVKRLNRKTICYAKRMDVLEYLIRIYAWS